MNISPGPVVAIMQPYFFPYAGYFRLLVAADVFIVLDDVQFPRRGRVHRSEISEGGASRWLTLPLRRDGRDVRIKDIAFHANARALLDRRLRQLPWLNSRSGSLAQPVSQILHGSLETPYSSLEAGLSLVCRGLGLPAERFTSSSVEVDHNLRGEAYIIALVKAVGGRTYVNAPGGRQLYNPANFSSEGIALKFLRPYEGRFRYLLPALMTEPAAVLRADVFSTTALSP